MLRKLMNEAFLTLRITTTGPLLIKSGHASVSGPDMTPVLTWRNGNQEVFLPGSSLKGIFRSHLEKIACSLKPRVVCYPFEGNEEKQADLEQRRRDYRDSCGGMFNQIARREDNRRWLEERSDLVYAASCPACRLFGSTGFIGRVAISDAYLVSNEIKEQRDGIGIDRLTGGASHGAKFELEVVSSGVAFETEIHLRNYEVWQLGMLFAVLQDMEDELIRIGSGRSRGLGKVKAEISGKSAGGLVVSPRRLLVLSAILMSRARSDLCGAFSTCRRLRSPLGLPLSSVTSETSPATSAPNSASSSATVVGVSSTVSCRRAAMTRAGSCPPVA